MAVLEKAKKGKLYTTNIVPILNLSCTNECHNCIFTTLCFVLEKGHLQNKVIFSLNKINYRLNGLANSSDKTLSVLWDFQREREEKKALSLQATSWFSH